MRLRFLSVVLPIAVLAVFAACASGQKNQSFDPEDEASCNKAVGPRDDSSAISIRRWVLDCGQADIDIESGEFAALTKAESAAPKPESQAYKALLDAFEKYRGLLLPILAKGCAGGTGCGADMSVEEAAVNYWFLDMARGFREAGFRQFTEKEYADADAELNAEYKRTIAGSPANCADNDLDDACISQQEIRAMERAWLAYREAWVAYAAIKWPNVPAITFRILLTLQQAKRL